MSNKPAKIMSGVGWTVGPYAISAVQRFGTNVILSHLLAPEIFGIMLIVTTIRTGIELVTDVGIGQNIVHNRNGGQPDFYWTAWTIQVLRGAALAGVIFLVSFPASHIFEIPAVYIQTVGLVTAIYSLQSPGGFLLQRNLAIAKHNLFDLFNDIAFSVIAIGIVYYSPTVWGLLAATIGAAMVRASTSFLLPAGRPRFTLDKQYVAQIGSFGKWVFLASMTTFICGNFDRLYLGHAAPLAILGVFGIARSISEVPASLSGRLGHVVVFPLIASARDMAPEQIRLLLAPTRFKLLVVAAVVLAAMTNVADLLIIWVYDHRYDAAAWMLPILLVGVWPTILSVVGEYTLMGLGRPDVSFRGNAFKLVLYVIGLPLSYTYYGILGAVVFVAISDLPRYVVSSFNLTRENISFLRQDAVCTVIFVAAVALMTFIRSAMGLGTPFNLAF